MKFFPAAVVIALAALAGFSGVDASPVARSSELHDVLDEFLALFPQEKVAAIIVEYLEKDAQFQAVAKYMSSDGFRELVQRVESIEDVINFYDYLDESGLDVYGLVNKLHEFIGLPPLVTDGAVGTSLKITGGIAGLLKDIKAVLPIADIKALYHDKLKTSPAFAQLVKRLGSPKCQALINALRANDEFRKIVAFARDAGVDLAAIKDLLATIFGLEFPDAAHLLASKLDDDLQDFVDLLPAKKIRKLAIKHYLFDKEFRRAVTYIRSEPFHALVRKLHEIPAYGKFLESLAEVGLDVEKVVKKIHDAISFKESPSPDGYSQGTIGVKTFITEVKAIMPGDAIKMLYAKKLETSSDFVRLVEVLSSEQFQAVTDALFADATFRDFLGKLRDNGVNLGAISDFFFRVFGITTPPGIID